MEHIENRGSDSIQPEGPMLIRNIEKFLRENDMPPTRFGRLVASDPRFVLDLRNGREPRPLMEVRVEAFMRGYREARHAA